MMEKMRGRSEKKGWVERTYSHDWKERRTAEGNKWQERLKKRLKDCVIQPVSLRRRCATMIKDQDLIQENNTK